LVVSRPYFGAPARPSLALPLLNRGNGTDSIHWRRTAQESAQSYRGRIKLESSLILMMLRRDKVLVCGLPLREDPCAFYLEVWRQMFQTPPLLNLAPTGLFRESATKGNQLTWTSLRSLLLSSFFGGDVFSCFIYLVKHRHKDIHVEQKHGPAQHSFKCGDHWRPFPGEYPGKWKGFGRQRSSLIYALTTVQPFDILPFSTQLVFFRAFGVTIIAQ
jgi:hypothetical protein